eukprot:Colp12_sorted_trinity150504_noHs@22925
MASLADLLAQKALKKAGPSTVAVKAPEAVRPQICETEDDYLRLMDDAKFEEYWDLIQPLSFASKFFDLPRAAASELRAAHLEWSANKTKAINWADYPTLSAVIDQMQVFFESSPWKALFVRLSSRSPKDAALSRPDISAKLKEEYCRLRPIEENLPLTTPETTLLHALYRVSTVLLKADAAATAMQLLVESKRIQGDLEQYLKGTDATTFNFILREFADFEPENEFRAFVYDRKLTAVTQYNETCFFPMLGSHVEEFTKCIFDVIENQVIPVLPSSLHNSIVDIVIVKNPEVESGPNAWQVKIVEINPFAEFAGTGLFTWERDWKILRGREPFEFRYAKVPPNMSEVMKNLSADWRKVIEDAQIF